MWKAHRGRTVLSSGVVRILTESHIGTSTPRGTRDADFCWLFQLVGIISLETVFFVDYADSHFATFSASTTRKCRLGRLRRRFPNRYLFYHYYFIMFILIVARCLYCWLVLAPEFVRPPEKRCVPYPTIKEHIAAKTSRESTVGEDIRELRPCYFTPLKACKYRPNLFP